MKKLQIPIREVFVFHIFSTSCIATIERLGLIRLDTSIVGNKSFPHFYVRLSVLIVFCSDNCLYLYLKIFSDVLNFLLDVGRPCLACRDTFLVGENDDFVSVGN